MIQQASGPDVRTNDQSATRIVTPFKPVALPALAAAVRAAQASSERPKNCELPAILRKQAILD